MKYPLGAADPNCNFGNLNWLGTDDQGRDVVARLIYGFRISVAFGLILTVLSSIIGMAAGAVQGYFGGWTDLLFQRFIDIWTSMPTLYLADHSRRLHHPDILDPAVHPCAVLVDGTRRPGPRRIPPGTEFRVCARRTGAGTCPIPRSCSSI